jgi:hypothetical protein
MRRTVSSPRPRRSATLGRKPKTNTSAFASSAWSTSLPLRRAHVEGKAFLALHCLGRADLRHPRKARTHGVARQVLNLDHAGAVRPHHRHAEGHGEEVAELDNRDPGERVGRRRTRRRCGRCRCRGQGLVLVEGGRRPPRLGGRVAEPRQRADLLDRARGGVVDGDDLAVGACLRVVHPLLGSTGQLEGDVGLGEQDRHPLGQRSLEECPEIEVLIGARVRRRGEHGRVLEPWVLRHPRQAEGAQRRHPLVGEQGPDVEPAAVLRAWHRRGQGSSTRLSFPRHQTR